MAHVRHMGVILNAYRILGGQLKEREHLVMGRMWHDNTEMELQLAQGRTRCMVLVG